MEQDSKEPWHLPSKQPALRRPYFWQREAMFTNEASFHAPLLLPCTNHPINAQHLREWETPLPALWGGTTLKTRGKISCLCLFFSLAGATNHTVRDMGLNSIALGDRIRWRLVNGPIRWGWWWGNNSSRISGEGRLGLAVGSTPNTRKEEEGGGGMEGEEKGEGRRGRRQGRGRGKLSPLQSSGKNVLRSAKILEYTEKGRCATQSLKCWITRKGTMTWDRRPAGPVTSGFQQWKVAIQLRERV